MLGKEFPTAQPLHQVKDGFGDMGVHAPDHVIQSEAGHERRQIHADGSQQNEQGRQYKMSPIGSEHPEKQAPRGSLSFFIRHTIHLKTCPVG